MASLLPFHPDHLSFMRVKKTAQATMEHPGMVEALKRVGHTIVASDQKTVLGVIGAVPTVPGVCEVFIVATEDQREHSIGFAKLIRKQLFTLRKEYRRIQAVSVADEFHYRWLSWLGFKAEGVLKKYGLSGEDMIMWGLTD
jgi:hypothetical protein